MKEEKNLTQIVNRLTDFKVGIIGLGYAGLPLALHFSKKKIKVIGFDTDLNKVELLNSGKSYIEYINDSEIRNALDNDFKAVNNFSLIEQVNYILVCVPTPLTGDCPDLSFIVSTLNSIRPYLKEGQTLILESTTYPGTTEELFLPLVERQFIIGENFYIGYSPEREDPGQVDYKFNEIPKICAGYTNKCLEKVSKLYELIVDKIIHLPDIKTAEITKIYENAHRAINIAFVNEFKTTTDKMGIDITKVINAASTKPFGFTKYWPGPGVGGHCIPVDPYYLLWKLKDYGLDSPLVRKALEINKSMPSYSFSIINDYFKRNIKDKKILIIGITYKKNVQDPRESPVIKLMEILEENGAEVFYTDSYHNAFPEMRNHSFDLKSRNLEKELILSMDAVVIGTDHDYIDNDLILKNAKVVFDTRRTIKLSENVIYA